MSEFDILLEKFTTKGQAKVHGALFQCVDKNGDIIYNKIAGYDSLQEDAAPLREDCVFKMGSATKVIVCIALLQCIDNGLIGLDAPAAEILPELDNKEVLTAGSDGRLNTEPSRTKITFRHLLSHASGLGYHFLHPLLVKWDKTAEAQKRNGKTSIAEKYNYPLVFHPGEGWTYGVGMDWAGLAVRRLSGMTLEEYLNEHVWGRVGLCAPFPTFRISQRPEYKARLMQGAERAQDGSITPYEFWQGNDPNDEDGGHALSATAKDYLAVLADLISDSPKLLKPETVTLMLEPQLAPDSPAMAMMLQLRPVLEALVGPIPDEGVNHDLIGLVSMGEVPSTGQPKGIATWGGASGVVWFVAKDAGVAGFFGTQVHPIGDAAVTELFNAGKKDFWSASFRRRHQTL